MPPDTSNSSRRSLRKSPGEDDTDIRRVRGEISCAECRRLKLKCDKRLPCSSCVRRGCSSICPIGSLSTGQGTRLVLADTEQLHRKIADMGRRIRDLEDALAIFQAGNSSEAHPLLSQDLLSIKHGSEIHNHEDETTQGSGVESLDSLGTLHISEGGEATYFGRSAGSETLFMAATVGSDAPKYEDEETPLSPDIIRMSNSFPFGSHDAIAEDAIDTLYSLLPPQPRAWSLFETYMEHASWVFRPVRREELIDDILTPIYKAARTRPDLDSKPAISPHKIAVLFTVFALGALMDLTLPTFNSESKNYFTAARAALSLRPILDSPDLSTIQAIVLMASYHTFSINQYTLDSAWCLLSLGAKLAQRLGLHRDSARWNLDPKTVQRRRALFWELFAKDLFFSLALGRPPSISLSYVDCEFPEVEEQSFDEHGNPLPTYFRWKYEYTKQVFSKIIEPTLAAKVPSYNVILDLDRMVREKVLPQNLDIMPSPQDDEFSPSAYMQGRLLAQFRSVSLMYIHRSFFAQALLDFPSNPLRSPYAPSFLAAYRCASAVIKAAVLHFERFPELCMRWWIVWTHLLSASIIVGSIATRAPSSTMAPTAFIELGLAVDLFEKAAIQSPRARSGLTILVKLRSKAHQVFSQSRTGSLVPNIGTLQSVAEHEDELAIFGGQTRVLVTKLLSKKPTKQESPSISLSSHSSPTDESQGSSTPSSDSIPEVHPSLVEYLSQFSPSAYSSTPANTGPISSAPLPYLQPQLQSTPWNEGWATEQWSASIKPPPTPEDSIMFNDGTQGATCFQPPAQFENNSESLPCNFDFGMSTSGESGMDEQWMSFMRASGILDADYSAPL